MAAKVNFPLSPEILDIRRILGDAVNLHGKVDTIDTEVGLIQTDVTSIKTKTDNLPADLATEITAIQGATFVTGTDSLEAIRDRVDTLVGTPVTSVSADVAAVKTVADGIQSDLDNATDGLGAIKSAVDAVQTDLDDATNGLAAIKTAVVGVQSDLDNGTDGLGALKTLIDSVQSSVSAIQNNTRLTTSIAPEVDTPDTGSTYHKFFVNLYDASGNKEDPDSDDIAVVLTASAGTDLTDTRLFQDSSDTALAASTEFVGLSKLVKDSVGRYYFFYKSTSTDAEDTLNVQLRYNEGAVENNADRSLRVVEELGNAAATAANQVAIMGTGFSTTTDSLKVLSEVLDVIDGNVGTLVLEIGSMTDILGAGNADLADVLTDLGGTTFDTSTDSNEAIRNRVDTLIGTPVTSVSSDIAAVLSAVQSQSSLATTFGAVKTSAALAQAANEVVTFSTSEGVTTNNSKLAQLKVTVTGASSNFTVQVFEKTGTPGANLVFEVTGCENSGINLDLNSMIFRNADTTATNVIYVNVINVTDASTSTFAVEMRGELAN